MKRAPARYSGPPSARSELPRRQSLPPLCSGSARARPKAAAQQPPAVVSVDAVRMEAMAQTVPVIGRLVAQAGG